MKEFSPEQRIALSIAAAISDPHQTKTAHELQCRPAAMAPMVRRGLFDSFTNSSISRGERRLYWKEYRITAAGRALAAATKTSFRSPPLTIKIDRDLDLYGNRKVSVDGVVVGSLTKPMARHGGVSGTIVKFRPAWDRKQEVDFATVADFKANLPTILQERPAEVPPPAPVQPASKEANTMALTVKAKAIVEVELEPSDLAGAVFQMAFTRCGKPDDAGLDWCTDGFGNTYIGDDVTWQVSRDPPVATLIDAYHVLSGRAPLKLSDPNEREAA